MAVKFNIDELINEWTEVKKLIDELELRKAKLTDEIMPYMEVGQVIRARSGNAVRMCQKADLKGDLLVKRVPKALWNKITKRVPVASMVKAEIERGTLPAKVVEDCRIPSNPWLERR